MGCRMEPWTHSPRASQWWNDLLVTTPTTRGEIFDRNGKGLAITETVYEIGIDPGRFTDNLDQEIETC